MALPPFPFTVKISWAVKMKVEKMKKFMRDFTVMSGLFVLFLFCLFINGCESNKSEALEEESLQDRYPNVMVYKVGSRITRIYGQAMSFGNSPEETAESFRVDYASIFGLEPDNLQRADLLKKGNYAQSMMFDRQKGKYKFTLLKYVQHINDIPVFRSDLRLLVSNSKDSPLVLAASSLRMTGSFSPKIGTMKTRTDLANIAASEAHRVDSKGEPIHNYLFSLTHFTEPETVIWAGVGDQDISPILALTYIGDNSGDPDALKPEKWLFVADAQTGKILYTESLILTDDVNGNVSGYVTDGYYSMSCLDDVLMVFPYAEVNIEGGNTAFTDTDGNFIIPNNGTSSVTVNSFLGGERFDVFHYTGTNEELSMTITPPGPANFEYAQDTDKKIKAQRNGYIFANEIRDWALNINSTYPVIPGQTNFPVYVNRTGGYCPGNAWYNGVSINFCSASENYGNTAFGSIEHHEYGHHLVNVGGSGQGEYGEGMADCVAMLIADDPQLGVGFFLDQCNTPLRNADNTCQYDANACSTCGSEIHACGKLLSGAIWSVRNELFVTEESNYLNILSNLTLNSILLHTGSSIDSRITIDFLNLDDNDGDLSNGTPHWSEICNGFNAHGLDCPLGLSVNPSDDFIISGPLGGPFHPTSMAFTLENKEPRSVDYAVTSNANWLTVTGGIGTLAAGASAIVTVSINSNANSLLEAMHGDTIDFVNTTDGLGNTTRNVQLWVGGPAYSWNMDTDPGWTREGLWAWGEPQGGGGQHGNPDPTGGFTGDNVYGYNLEGDYKNNLPETHLTTLPIDCTDLKDVTLKFYRWLGVEQPAYDHAYIRVSNEGNTWTTIWENTSVVEDDSWTLQEFDISAVADGEPTVYIRWTLGTTDASWQYAGWNIDNVEIWAGSERCDIQADCDDELYCNGTEDCINNSCVAGIPLECDDGVDCTDDSCNEATDSCISEANHTNCDNDIFCDGQEICDLESGCQTGNDPCPYQACDEEGDRCSGDSNPMLEANTVLVGGTPVIVALSNSYSSPVVVCTIQYTNNDVPIVPRVSNVTPDSFDVYLQNPSGGSVMAEQVNYLVVEEGVWNIDGVMVEAQSYFSTVTDENNSWIGQPRTYGQSYSNPVVLGQVMSDNDPDWSVFWCRGNYRTRPPLASTLYTGKAVGEDADISRSGETVGLIIFEAGHGTIGDVAFEALLGADIVKGMDNSPPFTYLFSSAFASVPEIGVATMAGVDGSNGGWANLYGIAPFTATTMKLFIDEDQLSDEERSHPTEQAGYAVFESAFVYPMVSECTEPEDCYDDFYCNGEETCVDGQCQIGVIINCDDGVSCTLDACNESTDSCDNTPNDALCQDALYCNGEETCDAIMNCQAGTPVNCNDGVNCTLDACNETSDACDNTQNHGLCNDGLYCNGSEICHPVLDCQAGSDPCPEVPCDEENDHCECLTDSDCDDDLFCNGEEICMDGACQPGTDVTCYDSVSCTIDTCNESTDTCENVPDDALCDDGLFCTGNETCNALTGCQIGSDPCPNSDCDENTDECQGSCLPSGTRCYDNNDCCSGVCSGWWISKTCA